MAIRWRENGTLICAAMSDVEEGDTYINDRLHYQLSIESNILIADIEHEQNGLWHWTNNLLLRASLENDK